MSKVFAYRDLAVRVECDRVEPLQWLGEFLSPAFEVREQETADCTVALVVDRREYDAARARGPRADGARVGCFALDGGLVQLPWWTPAGGEQLVFDGEVELFYCLSRGGTRVRVLGARERPSQRIGLLRVVRELAVSRAWSATSMVTHAAALAVGDTGIVIAGPPGAGKTSLLAQLLLCRRDTAFVANDRVVIDAGGGDITLRGMPTIVTMRPPPAARLPELHRRFTRARGDHRLTVGELAQRTAAAAPPPGAPLQFTPAQLCALLGVPMRGDTRPAVLLFPQVNEACVGVQLAALSPVAAAARLRTLFLGGAHPALSDLFDLASKPGLLDRPALDGLCRTVAERLHCFDCRLGRHADRPESARAVLDQVLAAAAAPRQWARAMAR